MGSKNKNNNNNKSKLMPGQASILTKMRDELVNMQNQLAQKDNIISTLQNEAQRLDFISFHRVFRGKIVFPKVETPLVSIIIPVYNQYKFTRACIAQVMNNTESIPYEVIIADDASTDETRNILNETENIIVSRNSINLGFLRNVNNAAKHARGKYICLLNNDTVPQKGWLKALLETMESHEDAGVVGAKFLYPNGLIQEAGCMLNNEGVPSWLGYMQNRAVPEFNMEREVDYCSGCGLLIKKSAWDELGGFDERYAPAFYEDPDLSLSMKHKLGLKTYYQPKSEIVHFHNVTYQHSNHTAFGNKVKFQEKWKEVLAKII